MPYSVLILDDDQDFNSLLTDIFEQADYIVTSVTDPIEAVEVFRETNYDLVVTDHKMPEMTGAEFMKVIKGIRSEVPVIIVSGYLENDTIRELISEGVGGVFLKPLNIFSLLERTVELIEEARKLEGSRGGEETLSDYDEQTAQLGFSFRSYPCKSGASASFAERLYSLRNFKSTLALIGERGANYRAICEDIRNFYESDLEQFIYFSADSFDEASTLSVINVAKKSGAERVTCVLLEVETMSAEQKELAISLAKHELDVAGDPTPIRTIFCVSGDLDALFDQELINENLYILMGTTEVSVPPLRICGVDVGVMAQQLVVEFAREKGFSSVPRFERSARDFFQQCQWEANYEELRSVVRRIVESQPGDMISLASVKSAIQPTVGASPRAKLQSALSNQKTDYLRAASILFGGNRNQTAIFFDTDASVISNHLK